VDERDLDVVTFELGQLGVLEAAGEQEGQGDEGNQE